MDYIVKIKGDTSQLDAALKRSQGRLKRLNDDEVLVHLNFDGNIKQFNKVFEDILDQCPELSIQFQYNVNQKLLDAELEKLKKLEQFRIDIDTDDGEAKIDSLLSSLSRAIKEGADPSQISEMIREIYKYANSAEEAGAEIGRNISESILNEVKDTDYEQVFKKIDGSKLKLFNFSGTLDDEIAKSKEKIDDLEEYMADLEDKGAHKLSDKEKNEEIEKDIRAIKISIEEMRAELDKVNGERFEELSQKIADCNEQLMTMQALLSHDIPGEVNQTRKVAIFDGVSEQIYDVIDDAEALEAKLDEMAQKMRNPAWQAGDLRHSTVNSKGFKFADSLQFALDRGGTTAGSGQYATYNLEDVIDWLEKQQESGHSKRKRGLFTLDLGSYPTLLKMPSDDYYDTLTQLFGAIHRLTSVSSGKKEYDLKGLDSPEKIFEKYESYFKDFGISLEQFKTFLIDENNFIKSLNADDALEDITATQNRFMKRFVGNAGFDASLVSENDSVALGSLIYPEAFDKEHPYAINWGGNIELARKFFDKVKKKQLEAKAANKTNDVEDLVRNTIPTNADYDEFLQKSQNLIEHLLKIQKQSEGISFESLNKAVLELIAVGNKAAQATQDSHSPSVVAEQLGEMWGIGYAEGIKKHKNDVEEAVRELVNTGKLTVEDLLEDQKNIASDNAYKDLVDPVASIIKGYESAGASIYKLARTGSTTKDKSKYKEHGAFINLATGYMSDIAEGKRDELIGEACNEIWESIEQEVTAFIHTHPSELAAFSAADIKSFIDDLQRDNPITMQLVSGFKELSRIDLSFFNADDLIQIANEMEQEFTHRLAEWHKVGNISEALEKDHDVDDAVDEAYERIKKELEENKITITDQIEDAIYEEINMLANSGEFKDIDFSDATQRILDRIEEATSSMGDDVTTEKFKGLLENAGEDIYEILANMIQKMIVGTDIKNGTQEQKNKIQELQRDALKKVLTERGFDTDRIYQTVELDSKNREESIKRINKFMLESAQEAKDGQERYKKAIKEADDELIEQSELETSVSEHSSTDKAVNEQKKLRQAVDETNESLREQNDLEQGLESGQNVVDEAARDSVRTADESTSDEQKSKSPSKVAEALGEYWGEGYAEGIKKHKDEVEAAVRELVRTGVLTTEDLQKDLVNIFSEKQYAPLIAPVKNVINSPNKLGELLPEDSELQKKAAEIDFLIKRIEQLYHSRYEGIKNEDMRYNEMFNTDEVKRLIELLSELSDAELAVLNISGHYDGGANEFRDRIEYIINRVNEEREELNQLWETGNDKEYEEADYRDTELSSFLNTLLDQASEVNEKYKSELIPTFEEFVRLVNSETDIPIMDWDTRHIMQYFNAIVREGKSVHEVFDQLKKDLDWGEDKNSILSGSEGTTDQSIEKIIKRYKELQKQASITEDEFNEIIRLEEKITGEFPFPPQAGHLEDNDISRYTGLSIEQIRELDGEIDKQEEKFDLSGKSLIELVAIWNKFCETLDLSEKEMREWHAVQDEMLSRGVDPTKGDLSEILLRELIAQKKAAGETIDEYTEILNILKIIDKIGQEIQQNLGTDFIREKGFAFSTITGEHSDLSQVGGYRSTAGIKQENGKYNAGLHTHPDNYIAMSIYDLYDDGTYKGDLLAFYQDWKDGLEQQFIRGLKQTLSFDSNSFFTDIVSKTGDDENKIRGVFKLIQDRVDELMTEAAQHYLNSEGEIPKEERRDQYIQALQKAQEQAFNEILQNVLHLTTSFHDYAHLSDNIVFDKQWPSLFKKPQASNKTPDLFQSESGQLSFIENLVEVEEKAVEGANELADELSKVNDQISGQMSLDDLENRQQQAEEKLLPAVIETNDAYKERMRIADQAFQATMQQTTEAEINRDITATLEQRRKEQEKLNEAKKEEPVSSPIVESVDTKAEEAAKEEEKEAEAMADVKEESKEAAASKEKFALANAKVLQSIKESLTGLGDEANAFNALNNLINKLSGKGSDERITTLINNLIRVRDALSGTIEDNGFIASLQKLAEQGENLKDLAEVLKASKKQLETAKEAIKEPELSQEDRDALAHQLAQAEEYEREQKRILEIEKEINKAKAEGKKQAEAFAKAQEKQVKKSEKDLANQRNSLTAKGNSLIDKLNKEIINGTGKYDQSLINQWQELKEDIKKFNGDIKLDSADLDEAETKIKKFETDFEKITSNNVKKENKLAGEDALSKINAKIEEFRSKNTNLGKELSQRLDEVIKRKERLLASGLNGNALEKELKAIDAELNNIKAAADRAGESGKSFGKKIKDSLINANARFLANYFSIQDMIRYVRQFATTVKEVDSALTELRKVSDASNARLQQNFQKSAETAKELGSSITDVINQTADWARLGYNVDEAETLARVTTLFQTVGDNMTADSASEAMISTLKAYDMRVEESERIVDKYNEVANNFAIDTAGLADAITRAGAALSAGGNDLSKSMAMVVAANDALQDPDSVGQMLKTMSMRLRGASAADLEELGIDTTGMTQGKKSIVQQYKAMAGIDIMEGTNYKSTYQILDELHDKWADLTDAERAAITEATSGKRGGSVMSSLMENWEDAQAVVEKAEGSMGSAMKEQQNYAQSIQFSLDRLNASWQEFQADVLSSSFVKKIVDFANDIVNALDKIIDHPLLVGGIASVIGGGLLTKNNVGGLKNTSPLSYFALAA